MCLGALVDSGVPLKEIEKGLKRLNLKGYALRERKVARAGIAATKVDVVLGSSGRKQSPPATRRGRESEVRRWKDVQQIIKQSSLPEKIKRKGHAILKILFDAEAKVHGKTISTTHLHELGSVDCLVDVFGTLIGLSILGVEKVSASRINVGSGTVETDHGILPVPAPATAELLKGIPCYASGPSVELTTPTGAAILKTLSTGFGDLPQGVFEQIGLGAGNRVFADRPNILRVMIGEAYRNVRQETVMVIETNIDDMNPQVYEYVIDRLFAAGALDVYLTPVIMKKSRPGIVLTVLCHTRKRNDLMDIILKETTTLGVRYYEAGRVAMQRQLRQFHNSYGTVRIKDAAYGFITKSAPEYEDCRRIAAKSGRPLFTVLASAECPTRRRKK